MIARCLLDRVNGVLLSLLSVSSKHCPYEPRFRIDDLNEAVDHGNADTNKT